MSRPVYLFWLLLSLAGPALAQPFAPPASPLFDDTAVHQLWVSLAPDDLAAILDPANQASDTEYPAALTFIGPEGPETVDPVGFRLRGNTSRAAQKKSFKVSFNTFVPGQRFHGLEKLNLNGEHNDPSLLRAKLSWDLFQDQGVPASRAAPVQLYINGDYFGLYTHVEHLDERFLKTRFGNAEGTLYKCLWPADLTVLGSTGAAYRPGPDRRPYDLKLRDDDDEGYDDLAALIDVINNTSDEAFPAALEAMLEVNSVLRALAIDVVTGSWDDYWFLKNNFYLYNDPDTGLFHWIPFDFDNTFGIWWDGILPGLDWGTRDVYGWGHPSEPRPLMTRLLQVPAYRDRFTFYLRQALEGPYDPALLLPRIDALYALITEAAEGDPFRPLDYGFTVDDFHASFDAPLGGHVTYGLKPFVQTRHQQALAQLEAVDVAPILSELRHRPRSPRRGDPVVISVRIEDEGAPAAVWLHYSENGGPQQLLTLNDDGRTGDPVAGDGYYGATIPAGTALVLDYHVHATDAAGQGGLSITRTVGRADAAPALRINELMANNTATLAGPTGAFPDWAELFHAGAAATSLSGLFLTDDFNQPDRWALPDTVLQPGDHLLVWLSGEAASGPLHAPFRLDRAGEQLGLFDAAGLVVDTLSFGPQEPDRAFGRPHGGLPPAVLHHPTPGAPNSLLLTFAPDPALPAAAPQLAAPYPNPFATVTSFTLALPRSAVLRAQVFDLLGRPVRLLAAGRHTAGPHMLRWDGLDARGQKSPPGVYFIRVDLEGASLPPRSVLLVY